MVFTRWRSLLIFITCFTLGHSLTLVLATCGWVDLPERVTEPLIAATILMVGLDNLRLRGRDPGTRGVITVVFGLAHGLGFAHVLRELGVGAAGSPLALPLLGFNLGVEVGQLGVAAVLAPLFYLLRKLPDFVRFGVPAVSAGVAALGAYWLIERMVFA